MVQGNFNGDLNGKQIIQYFSKKEIDLNKDFIDSNTIERWFDSDLDMKNLGILTQWGDQAVVSNAFYMDFYGKLAFLDVNGDRGSFYYDIPISTTSEMVITRDTSNQIDPSILGKNLEPFRVVLNTKLKSGHIIGLNHMDEHQIIVMNEDTFPIRKLSGNQWEHYVQLVTKNREETYPAERLVTGTVFEIISHNMFGEFADNYANVRATTTGEKMRCKFTLENMTGVEAMVTGRADRRRINGVANQAGDFQEALMKEYQDRGEYAVLTTIDNLLPDGSVKDFNQAYIGDTMQLLVHREHHRLLSSQLIFQQGGSIKTEDGYVDINEGLYWQYERAYTIQYETPMGIQRHHLQEASDYVYRLNPYLKIEDRHLSFDGGKFAVENVKAIIQDESKQQIANLAPFMGSENQLPSKVITGNSLTELQVNLVSFAKVFMNGIGWVSVREEPALNFLPKSGDSSLIGGIQGKEARTAYSLIIRDVTDQKYSNNTQKPEGVQMTFEGGSYDKNNEFIVKPEKAMTYWGSENGRYHSRTVSDIVSSSRYQTQTYWIYSICATWVKDLSRIVIIELDKKAFKGF